MTANDSNSAPERRSLGSRAGAAFRWLFIRVHKPGAGTIASMLAFAAGLFAVAYALGNLV